MSECCCPVFQAEGEPRRMVMLSCCPTHAPDAPPPVAPRASGRRWIVPLSTTHTGRKVA